MALAQPVPYIGYVYPAGGQLGTTFQVQLGGQRLDEVHHVLVSGTGVSAQMLEYRRQLGPQEARLLKEQLRELTGGRRGRQRLSGQDEATQELVARIEKRIAEFIPRPASVSLASTVVVEVTLASDAEPGAREIRLVTRRGITNPLVFHVGQVPEVARKPVPTCPFQVLGKEQLAQRNRPPEEEEARITLPCTTNGQIAPGEVNRYRFAARQGQRLVISVAARQLIPYIADAVPGWFQPVLTLSTADGQEVAFNDDYRFKPDPTLFWEVLADGEYVLSITDALFRGREDFVYRVTIGELPFVTSVFPLGGRTGVPETIALQGWNLEHVALTPLPTDARPGVHLIAARSNAGYVSNDVPFELDTLPECMDLESNDDPSQAQTVQLPVIVNGHLDRPHDWDVFRVEGRAGDTLVAEVHARRLDSPIDSLLQLTDAAGKVLAFNDDCDDPGSGLQTHHADSYLMYQLPADGSYFVHLGDTARHGGEEYAYRLRISAPRPDFALRVVPSGGGLRSKGAAPVSVYAIRKDGFTGDIQLSVKNPPDGFFSPGAVLRTNNEMVRLPVRTSLASTEQPVRLAIEGRAVVGDQEVTREAVPADDRMQAFLWRHLVPAADLVALVFDPAFEPPLTRVPPPSTDERKPDPATDDTREAPKFTARQVAGRLRQLKALYEEWLLTDDFYNRQVAECEAAL
jgi:hypothetical protein